MTAEEFLLVVQKADDYNHTMTPIIKKYGEMLLSEYAAQPKIDWKKIEQEFMDYGIHSNVGTDGKRKIVQWFKSKLS